MVAALWMLPGAVPEVAGSAVRPPPGECPARAGAEGLRGWARPRHLLASHLQGPLGLRQWESGSALLRFTSQEGQLSGCAGGVGGTRDGRVWQPSPPLPLPVSRPRPARARAPSGPPACAERLPDSPATAACGLRGPAPFAPQCPPRGRRRLAPPCGRVVQTACGWPSRLPRTPGCLPASAAGVLSVLGRTQVF